MLVWLLLQVLELLLLQLLQLEQLLHLLLLLMCELLLHEFGLRLSQRLHELALQLRMRHRLHTWVWLHGNMLRHRSRDVPMAEHTLLLLLLLLCMW